jgi:hypothetical protein
VYDYFIIHVKYLFLFKLLFNLIKTMQKNTPIKAEQPKLLDVVRDKIRVKHYSIRTENQYLQWVKRYILFHNKRHPREMGGKEVNRIDRVRLD